MSKQTGIEIQVALTPGQKTIGKVLHALHLDKIGAWVAKMEQAVIKVDGQRREEPLYEAHFIETSPGTHTVEMFMRGGRKDSIGEALAPITNALSEGVFGASMTVTVEPGTVTVLIYTPQDGGGAQLELVGTRPA
jgi:hypothetical protein